MVLMPMGVFLTTYIIRERAFTQMHNQREDTYRNFERPVARWRMKNSWVAHMRYPPTVTPLLMAKQTHTLFWEQRKTLQDLLFAEKTGDQALIRTCKSKLADIKSQLLLLGTIRTEARRYVKSEAMFQDPNFLDRLVVNSAAANLHDLEEEACVHLSHCFFTACALGAAEAVFLEEDSLFMVREEETFQRLRRGSAMENLALFFNARTVGMWRRMFEKNLEHEKDYVLNYWKLFRKNPRRFNHYLTCNVASKLVTSFEFCPPELEKHEGLRRRLHALRNEVELTCEVCKVLNEKKKQRRLRKSLPLESFFPQYIPEKADAQVKAALLEIARKEYYDPTASVLSSTKSGAMPTPSWRPGREQESSGGGNTSRSRLRGYASYEGSSLPVEEKEDPLNTRPPSP